MKNKKQESLFYFGAGVLVLFFLNIILSNYFFRIDLTEEKRFSISDASKDVLKKLDDVVYIEVYLEGEFPGGFKRLQKSIKETLNEFRIYSNNKVSFQFIDPSLETDPQKRNNYYYSLAQKGIQPTNLFANEGEKKVEKLIFPGALISYGNKEVGVLLLKGNTSAKPEEMLNQSIENVEFDLINAIKELTRPEKKKVAVITGNAELDTLQSIDLLQELSTYYKVDRVNIREVGNLDNWDAIIVAKPQKTFSDDEKIKIDQFVVNGGKAVFMIDALRMNLDSITENGAYAFPYNLNLDDLFFKWGVRIMPNYLQDVTCGMIPIKTGMMGDQPQIQMLPWVYHPIVNSFGKHPIVKNMDALLLHFAGTIDTVKSAGITKTPLAFSGKYCRVSGAPVNVTFNDMRKEITPTNFSKSALPVAYLLEGKFKSIYGGSPLFSEKYPGLAVQNKHSKIVIMSDGDFAASDIDTRSNQIIPMGKDRFLKKKFANRDFLINSISYLLDDNGLINVRNKVITMRSLDKIKIKEEKQFWQLLNIILPVSFILLFGTIRFYLRKKRFENN